MDYIDTLLIMEDDLDEDEDLGEFGQSLTGQPTLTTSRPMTQDSENQDQAVASVRVFQTGVFVADADQCHKK